MPKNITCLLKFQCKYICKYKAKSLQFRNRKGILKEFPNAKLVNSSHSLLLYKTIWGSIWA